MEAYNGYLNSKIIAHPNFFALINSLRDEEFHKSREFELLFSNANPPTQRRYYRIRDQKIKKMSKLLMNKQIDVDTFLNGIASPDNGIFDDRHVNFMENGTSDDEMSDEDVISENIPNQDVPGSSGSSAISGRTCVICYEATSNVILSCGHFKYCSSCFNMDKACFDEKMSEFQLGQRDDEPIFKCPYCQQKITGHMVVEKIFVD